MAIAIAKIDDVKPALQESINVAAFQAMMIEGKLKLEIKALKVQRLSYQKRLEYIQDNMPSDYTTAAWCADLTEDLTGEVGTIEIPGEIGTLQIQPGFGSTAGYSPHSDGQLTPTVCMTPAQTFYNLAMLPGWQKWKPVFRYATIDSISGDTATITLDTTESSQQALNINQTSTISGVEIEYMSCNGAAFETDDEVLVKFEYDWATPKIVGFKDNPKPCSGYLILEFSIGNKVVVWDLAANDYANIKNNDGDDVTFPCTPASISNWTSSKTRIYSPGYWQSTRKEGPDVHVSTTIVGREEKNVDICGSNHLLFNDLSYTTNTEGYFDDSWAYGFNAGANVSIYTYDSDLTSEICPLLADDNPYLYEYKPRDNYPDLPCFSVHNKYEYNWNRVNVDSEWTTTYYYPMVGIITLKTIEEIDLSVDSNRKIHTPVRSISYTHSKTGYQKRERQRTSVDPFSSFGDWVETATNSGTEDMGSGVVKHSVAYSDKAFFQAYVIEHKHRNAGSDTTTTTREVVCAVDHVPGGIVETSFDPNSGTLNSSLASFIASMIDVSGVGTDLNGFTVQFRQ